MLRSILGGIFASTLFLTTNATAQSHLNETHYFLHLRTKNGSPSGEFYSSRDFTFTIDDCTQQGFADVSFASADGKWGMVLVRRWDNEPLGVGEFRSQYDVGSSVNSRSGISVSLRGPLVAGERSEFYCPADEK